MKKYAAFATMALLIALTVTSCSKAYTHFGKKLKSATIVDSGELYSTYELDENEIEDLKSSGVSDAAAKDFMNYCNEASWPEQIATLEGREEVRPEINRYTCYYVGKFGGDKYVLVIPASKNKGMPQGMAPKHDIYFIIGQSGVEM